MSASQEKFIPSDLYLVMLHDQPYLDQLESQETLPNMDVKQVYLYNDHLDKSQSPFTTSKNSSGHLKSHTVQNNIQDAIFSLQNMQILRSSSSWDVNGTKHYSFNEKSSNSASC